jgi:hypothetical protein
LLLNLYAIKITFLKFHVVYDDKYPMRAQKDLLLLVHCTSPVPNVLLSLLQDLIESYLMDYNSLGTKLEFLRARMQNTDELVSASDKARRSSL